MKRPDPGELVREHPWTALAIAVAAGALLAAARRGDDEGEHWEHPGRKSRLGSTDDAFETESGSGAADAAADASPSPIARLLDGLGALVMKRATGLIDDMHRAADDVAPDRAGRSREESAEWPAATDGP